MKNNGEAPLLPNLTSSHDICPHCGSGNVDIKKELDGVSFLYCVDCTKPIRQVLTADDINGVYKKPNWWNRLRIMFKELNEARHDYYLIQRHEYKEPLVKNPDGSIPIREIKNAVFFDPRTKQWVNNPKGLPVVPFWTGVVARLIFKRRNKKSKKEYEFSLMSIGDAMFIADVTGEEEPATKDDLR